LRTRSKRLPVTLSETERRDLLAQPNPRYPTGERNQVFLKLMLDTGLRLAEATALQWRDVDLLTGKLVVRRGKGSKDRVLWMNEDLADALSHWRQRQIDVCGASVDYVFTTLQGGRLSHRYVQAMVRRYAKRAGIRKRVTPHVLRHTFATDLYRLTGKIRLVQKALGHSDLSTTMIYTHVYDCEVKEAMRLFRDLAPAGRNRSKTAGSSGSESRCRAAPVGIDGSHEL